jgi:Protein of unknown function (DUF1553)/Protein of unknown function (DUF1549)/Planctomycete cytochrome C
MIEARLSSMLAGVLAGLHVAIGVPAGGQTVDFNRDIRPILADNCYQCHGPDAGRRKARLRLDTKEGIFSRRDGDPPVVPGKPEASELYRRIVSKDPSERMPDPKSGKSLAARQIALIKNWIEQGAQWKGHWAYIKPIRQTPPSVDSSGFVRNAVDRFVLAKILDADFQPSVEADRRTLVRRLHLDLLGLPPTLGEVEAFVRDPRPDAYERLVDRLLDSPHYGERMAMFWLDLVRYADSIGYHSDNPMPVSPYRDYVIRAFNENKPFDRFTVEQLAGDLLPGATVEQRVASAYNRLLMTTEEGGAQPKEYEAKYAADRVRNVSTVWLGTTLGCCQCHDHKFDPFSTREFYSFAAFFADVQEVAVGKREHGMPLPNPRQGAELKRLDARIAPMRGRLEVATALLGALAQWKTDGFGACGFQPAVRLALPAKVSAALGVTPAKRSLPQQKELGNYYRSAPALGPLAQELDDLEYSRGQLTKSIPRTLVTVSTFPRTTRVLPRGNWLDESGELVHASLPVSLAGRKTKEWMTRLDLARWITSQDNPLTARVIVNRLWKLFFGHGICRTLDDLGSQGEGPTHPELLDWLAVEFQESSWDVKHMVRLMVTSGAYRQTSKASAALREHDPYNRLIARQGRFRLDAEVVRDNALAISGLLCRQVSGPSVKPYQPAGYWQALNFPPREWHDDQGDGLHRRGMYTHWQRTFLYPSLLAFDAPTREECTVERPRSNIPQQALVLLNDPTYVEAARAFAERIIREGGAGEGSRITWAIGQALGRRPAPDEIQILMDLHDKHATEYARDRNAAEKLLHIGARAVPGDLDPRELAAWTSVARVILNLHETITRE